MAESNTTVKKQPGTNGFDKNPDNINTEGRPDNGWTWRDLYMEEVEKDSTKREGYKKKASVVAAVVEKAESGDIPSVKEINDRMEGKAKEFVDHTSKGERIDGFVVQFEGNESKDS